VETKEVRGTEHVRPQERVRGDDSAAIDQRGDGSKGRRPQPITRI